jgi:hypothetical protein
MNNYKQYNSIYIQQKKSSNYAGMRKSVEFFPRIKGQRPYFGVTKYGRCPYFFLTLKTKPESIKTYNYGFQ